MTDAFQVGTAPNGATTYLIDRSPEALPPVRSADLAEAWAGAREAAASAAWGEPRAFRFLLDDGETLDLALADEDACCWAAAVDGTAGIRTPYGLSLCLRLLALVDLLARVPALAGKCRFRRAGVALDPALVRTAATAPLTRQAGFDERFFQACLSHSGASH